jgi:hypothetical protein
LLSKLQYVGFEDVAKGADLHKGLAELLMDDNEFIGQVSFAKCLVLADANVGGEMRLNLKYCGANYVAPA